MVPSSARATAADGHAAAIAVRRGSASASGRPGRRASASWRASAGSHAAGKVGSSDTAAPPPTARVVRRAARQRGHSAGGREREHQPDDQPTPPRAAAPARRRDCRRRQSGRGGCRRALDGGGRRRAAHPPRHRFERRDDGVGVGGSGRRVLGEQRHDEAPEVGRHVGRARGQVGRRLRDVREQHLGDARRGRERQRAGAELVDDEAERVEVAARVDRLRPRTARATCTPACRGSRPCPCGRPSPSCGASARSRSRAP